MKITEIKPGNIIQMGSDSLAEIFLVTKVCEDFIWVIDKHFVFDKIYAEPSKYYVRSLDKFHLFADDSNIWNERVGHLNKEEKE